MANSDNIQEAVRRLGFFTGDIGESSFVVRLLNSAAAGGSIDPAANSDAFAAMSDSSHESTTGPLDALVGSLIGLTDGGTYISQFVANASGFVTGAPDDSLAASVKGTSERTRLFTVTGEQTYDTNFEFCGDAAMSVILADPQFNSSFDAPTKEAPNIATIQFHDAVLNFASRSSGIVGIFLNMLPTIELSKCQPYVDVKLLTKTPAIETFGEQTTIGNGISLLRFLHGKSAIEPDNPWALALPNGLGGTQTDIDVAVRDADGNIERDENGQPVMKVSKATVAGMEIFTSPQTLVNGNEPYYDIGVDRMTPAGRGASVIDRFRPFMTFKSFSVDVAPAKGMISTKSATMSMTLHDRSRLSEISQLVTPSGLADIEILVEYGWSHPEASGGDNMFATMLNSLRVKDKFQVVNSGLSFNEVGEVDISIKLVSKGDNDLTFRMVTDAEVAQTFDEINVILDSIKNLQRKIRKDLGKNEEMVGQQVIGKANSVSSIMSMSKEDMNELHELLSNLEKNSAEGTAYDDLAEKMSGVLTKVETLESKISTAMSGKLNGLLKTGDPYLKPCPGISLKASQFKEADSGIKYHPNYVSFAKIALEFIAKPLAASKKFEEVQLLFYPMNAYSTFARDDDVGSFPISYTFLKKVLMENLKKFPSMTIAQFIGMMNSSFFNNIASDVYGFGSIYERDPENGKSNLRAKYETGKKDATKVQSLKNEVYEAAYGPDGEKKFIKPSIQMYIETVPGADSDSGGDNGSICRIHFFDQAATAYTGFADLWESMRSSLNSAVNTAAIGALRAKADPDGSEETQRQTMSNYSIQFQQQLALLDKMDILEVIDAEGSAAAISSLAPAIDNLSGQATSPAQLDATASALNAKYVRIKGGPAGLKYMFHRNMPSIKYGSTYSAIIKASLQTQQDNRMATIHMQRAQKGGDGPEGGRDDGLPLRTYPGQLSLDMYGCPLMNFGQQYFVDFGTGTTLDDVYAVVGVSHKFSPGEFTTSVKMVPLQKFGTYQSVLGNFSKLIAEVASMGADAADVP